MILQCAHPCECARLREIQTSRLRVGLASTTLHYSTFNDIRLSLVTAFREKGILRCVNVRHLRDDESGIT